MRGMNSETVDLIYLDPPFNSNNSYSAPVGSKAAGAAFKDTWALSDLDVAWMGLIADEQPAIYKLLETARLTHGKGMMSYLCMMAVRLTEMKRLLKPTGSIYLHCDPYASHYLKLLMDAIFGNERFRNEVIWHYKSFHGQVRKYYPRKHDVMLMYTRSSKWTFNRQFDENNEDTIDFQRWNKYLVEGSKILGNNMPMQDSRFLRYYRRWVREHGCEPNPEDVVYEVKGQSLDTVWEIKPVDPKDKKERIGYPTQKPLRLLERMIAVSSDPGDIILDPFAGCATACVAAEQLDRQWIGIDLSEKAVELVNYRLKDTLGSLYHYGFVTSRKDNPQRTDIEKPPNYRKSKHVLFGQQEGVCNGCEMDFPFKIFAVDHKLPKSKGGQDHIENLQLLCGHCNSIKGDRSMDYLMAQLAKVGEVGAFR